MKKSIKYAGIAAATLLAVAPVAAPVVSSATETTVKADTTYTNATDAAAWLNNQLKSSYTLTETPTDNVLTDKNYGEDVNIKPYDFLKDSFYKQLVHSTLNTTDTTVNDQNAQVNVTATANDTSINNTLSASAANEILKDPNGAGITLHVTLTFNKTATDTDKVSKDIEVLPAQKTTTDDKDTITSLNATYTTPYSVKTGTSTVTPKLVNTLDLSLKDNNGNELANNTDDVTGVKLGGYFNSYSSALGATDATTAGDFTDATFGDKEATYYQPIFVTVKDSSDLQTFINDRFDKGYIFNINNNNAASNANSTITATQIKLVREIHVGQTSAFTEKDAHGVIVTKSDANYYKLHNDNNEIVTNRALAKATGWQFDKTRTDAQGNKQYRVSGHEWIPAEDVTVQSETGTDTDNSGSESGDALTVTKLAKNKVINLSTKGTIYFLYNKDGVRSDVRSLAGDSAWQIDKTATDAAGNTYYGVSTNEFVKAGEGVSLAD